MMPKMAVMLVALLLSGCAAVDGIQGWIGKKGVVEPAKLTGFSETAKFDVRWHASLGDGGASLLQPALTVDAVYGAAANGQVTRVERATGKQVWRIESGINITGGVGANDNLIVVGGNKGDVLAFDNEGKKQWQSKVPSEVLTAPRISDGVVLVRSGDGRIIGLDVKDGKRLWMYERATPALVVRSHAGVAVQRGVAFAGFAGGRLVAIAVKDGAVLWETSVSQPRGNTELERISDITSEPVADDGQVCAIAFQGRVSCYEPAQGSPLWNRDISSDKGMMLLRKFLYLSDHTGSVLSLEKSSGATLWKNEQLLMRETSAPYALDRGVVVGDYEGYLHALSRDDGSFIGRIKLDGSAVQTAPVGMDDGLLIQTRDGGLYSVVLN
ncbi:MAG: outer membrane protein assembly factor BamB [Gallionella sp.]|nr:outer membrane protein assembly factor BamB [Gallionella sp.]